MNVFVVGSENIYLGRMLLQSDTHTHARIHNGISVVLTHTIMHTRIKVLDDTQKRTKLSELQMKKKQVRACMPLPDITGRC